MRFAQVENSMPVMHDEVFRRQYTGMKTFTLPVSTPKLDKALQDAVCARMGGCAPISPAGASFWRKWAWIARAFFLILAGLYLAARLVIRPLTDKYITPKFEKASQCRHFVPRGGLFSRGTNQHVGGHVQKYQQNAG
ncbi:MAG: hypothetical protein PHP45_03460 [Elusimicrobiales bacterium]|nr:hypothetical protein [Elusimicrobiales bacterium]